MFNEFLICNAVIVYPNILINKLSTLIYIYKNYNIIVNKLKTIMIQ